MKWRRCVWRQTIPSNPCSGIPSSCWITSSYLPCFSDSTSIFHDVFIYVIDSLMQIFLDYIDSIKGTTLAELCLEDHLEYLIILYFNRDTYIQDAAYKYIQLLTHHYPFLAANAECINTLLKCMMLVNKNLAPIAGVPRILSKDDIMTFKTDFPLPYDLQLPLKTSQLSSLYDKSKMLLKEWLKINHIEKQDDLLIQLQQYDSLLASLCLVPALVRLLPSFSTCSNPILCLLMIRPSIWICLCRLILAILPSWFACIEVSSNRNSVTNPWMRLSTPCLKTSNLWLESNSIRLSIRESCLFPVTLSVNSIPFSWSQPTLIRIAIVSFLSSSLLVGDMVIPSTLVEEEENNVSPSLVLLYKCAAICNLQRERTDPDVIYILMSIPNFILEYLPLSLMVMTLERTSSLKALTFIAIWCLRSPSCKYVT